MTSYMIFSGPNNDRYAINSDDCLSFATDPVDKKYRAYPVNADDAINKDEPVEMLKADLDPAGCVVTEPAS